MATKKKTQETAEQTTQEAAQEQTTQEDTQEEQTGQEQTGQEDAKETEQDEFADLPNPCVYCGPSVRGMARQYTTYQGGIPDQLKAFIKAHPSARRLIVSTGKFAGFRRKLETNGTAEAIVYKKLKAEI